MSCNANVRNEKVAALHIYPDMTLTMYALALAGACCVGLSKSGFPGLAMINILLMAELFGAKESVGIILPLLIAGDLTVYPLFRKYASWRQVWPLIVPAVLGVLIGYALLGSIENETSRRVIGGIVLIMISLHLLEKYRADFLIHIRDSRLFHWAVGLSMGISTMMANAAGSIYSVYALVRKMPKTEFLGIGARYFLFVNLVKIPFMTDLDIINADSLKLDATLLPGVVCGVLLGRMLITKVPQRLFELLLCIFSIAAGIRLLFY
jgi:uncharacterized membrane protein YfcA